MRKVPLGTIMRLKPHGGRGLCARSGQVSPQLWCKVTFEVVALAKVGVCSAKRLGHSCTPRTSAENKTPCLQIQGQRNIQSNATGSWTLEEPPLRPASAPRTRSIASPQVFLIEQVANVLGSKAAAIVTCACCNHIGTLCARTWHAESANAANNHTHYTRILPACTRVALGESSLS